MMRIVKLAAYAAIGLVGALALAGTAQAGHNPPVPTMGEPGECGVTTFTLAQPEGDHVVDNVRLVVETGGVVQHIGPGESLDVGPFDTATATIRWRVFGGGERDYDDPLWNGHDGATFKDDINAYIAANGDGWLVGDDGDPFTSWHETEVKGCEPEPTPTPTPTATEPAEDDGEGGGLPATGTNLGALLGIGGVLMLGGGLAYVASRRRGPRFEI